MGLQEIAYLTTHDEKTAQSLVQLMQLLGKDTLTFEQLADKMRTKPRYLRFLTTKLRAIEFLRGNRMGAGSYRYYLSHGSFSTWCKTKLLDASYNLCKSGQVPSTTNGTFLPMLTEELCEIR